MSNINYHAWLVGLVTLAISASVLLFLAAYTSDNFRHEKEVLDKLSVGSIITVNGTTLETVAAQGFISDLKVHAGKKRTLRGSPTNSLYYIKISSVSGDVEINLYRDSREVNLYWMYFVGKEYRHWRIRTQFLDDLSPVLSERFSYE